jgi:hypothetical protein
MYTTTHHTGLQTIFGAGYVAEQHSEISNLPADDTSFAEFLKSLASLILGEANSIKH